MGRFLGVDFAPLALPMERRLQTLSVFYWISSFLFFGITFSALLGYLVIYTRYWWLAVLYLTWMFYDLDTCNRGGRSGWNVRFVRGWSLWKHFVNYFPIKLVKTCELDPKKNYLLGSHPHGVLCAGIFSCFGTEGANVKEVYPGLEPRLLTLEGQFWIPGYRELFASSGACAVSKRGMETLFSRPSGLLSVLVPGGAPESLNSDKEQVRLILKKRKGFIKLALRFGVNLVPSFSFGESFIFDQVQNPEGSWIRKAQDYLQHIIGFAPVLFIGRGIFQYSFGILPYRKPITVVVGAPIEVEKNQNPSVDDICELHERYSNALEDLYNQYNPLYGDKQVKLVIT